MAIDLDLHPDDLLHRARRARRLSRDEQVYLEAHLRDCGTCRFVRDAGRAFDSDADGGEGAPMNLDALVDRTMKRLRNSARARRATPRRLAAGVVTVVAMIGGVAFAGYWGSRHPTVAREPAPTRAAALSDLRRHHAVAAGAHQIAEAPPVAPAPVVGAAPVADSPPPVARRLAPAGHRLALVRPPDDVETSARLFEIANRARRQGDTAAAETAYDALWTKFRVSPEAVASRAIEGHWMLDRGKPNVAVAFFRQYLAAASRGDLEEDVLIGLADAHERAGESSLARATWRRLLADHPGSVHAGRAREGLRRLQPGTAP